MYRQSVTVTVTGMHVNPLLPISEQNHKYNNKTERTHNNAS